MSFLTRKYPFPKDSRRLRDCALYSTIVFLILFLLQPFGFSNYSGNKFLVSLLFGAVTLACCYLYGFVMKPIYRHSMVSGDGTWRVWQEVLAVLVMVLFIGIVNFFVFSYVFHWPFTPVLCLVFLYWTLIIGIVVTVFSVALNYHRYLRSQLETLLDKTTEEQADVVVTLRDTSVRGDNLQLPINDLLYIEAQKNNVSVCFMKDGKVQTAELHTTLTAVLDDLQPYGNIFQCHRSFVVNLNNITSAQGNSNGYRLKLGTCPTEVPVSRTYVPKLRSFIA